MVTDLGQKTTLATLYQAGEDIYNHFDKVVLLDEGREVFFGLTSEAKPYFESLGFSGPPGLTTAEFLISMLDPKLRTAAPGSIAASIHTTQDLADAFKQSSHYAALVQEIRITSTSHTAASGLVAGSQHILSYPGQVMECLRREYQLARRQARVYQMKWLTTIILCFACGSMYYDVTNTSQGMYTRGGILFFALIFNGWLQFPELFDAHTNRSVLERQGNTFMLLVDRSICLLSYSTSPSLPTISRCRRPLLHRSPAHRLHDHVGHDPLLFLDPSASRRGEVLLLLFHPVPVDGKLQ